MRRKTETDKLMKPSLEYAKLEVGMIGSLLDLDYETYEILCKDAWMKRIWQVMHKKCVEIKDDVGDFFLLRQNDRTICSLFASAYQEGGITREEGRKANLCRKYL